MVITQYCSFLCLCFLTRRTKSKWLKRMSRPGQAGICHSEPSGMQRGVSTMQTQDCHFPSSVGRRWGHDFETSHIADTWRWLGHCVCTCVCVCVGRDRERRGKAFVSATWSCPRAPWVITEEQGIATPPLLIWNLLNAKVRTLRSPPPPLVSLCVQINDCLLLPPCFLI